MHRETTLYIFGARHVIRTEMGGKIKTEAQLEAAHAKAFKAAIVAAHERHAAELEADGYPYGDKVREDGKRMAAGRAWGRSRADYVDCRKGFPKVSYGRQEPSSIAMKYPGVTFEEGPEP